MKRQHPNLPHKKKKERKKNKHIVQKYNDLDNVGQGLQEWNIQGAKDNLFT